MKHKLKYALAALAITAGPVIATNAPASAQLSNCSGYSNAAGAYNVCNAGTSGLMRTWIKWSDSVYPGLVFSRDGNWAGNGQWSNAFITACSGRCVVTSWGRSFSG